MKKPYRLYNGDCFEILKDFPENTFDMVFADPPYMLSNGGISCQNGKMVSVNKGAWDKSRGITEDFEFHKKWLELCKRVLKPNGTLWVSGTYHSIYSCGFAMLLLDYHILNDISWFKPNASPNLSCKYFTASRTCAALILLLELVPSLALRRGVVCVGDSAVAFASPFAAVLTAFWTSVVVDSTVDVADVPLLSTAPSLPGTGEFVRIP